MMFPIVSYKFTKIVLMKLNLENPVYVAICYPFEWTRADE